MLNITDTLLLAYRLSILTFYLGVLIYAIPVPWQGLKRWAPILIVDSITAVALIALYRFIVDWIPRLAQYFGGSWDYLGAWQTSTITGLSLVKSILVAIQVIPSGTPLSAIKAIASPLDRLVTGAIYFQAFIYGLTWLVKNFGKIILALGVAFYSIPFRIARGAGAWLIAFIIVFSLGLQAMPVFVSEFAGSPGSQGSLLTRYGLASAYVTVKTAVNGPANGQLIIYNGSGKELALYSVSGGVAKYYGSTYILVPSKTSVYYSLKYDGVEFPLSPRPVYPNTYRVEQGIWKVTLGNPYLLYASNGILHYTTGNLTGFSVVENVTQTFIYNLSMNPGDYFAVRYPEGCSLNISIVEGLLEMERFTWNWLNLRGEGIKLTATSSGDYSIVVSESCDAETTVKYQVKPYADLYQIVKSYLEWNFIEAFILYYFTVPSMYLFMLYSVTHGLARLLGGRERIPIRIT